MIHINAIVKEMGLNPMECPHCHRKIQTTGAIEAVFHRLVHRIRTAKEVQIPGFGTFRLIETKGREIKNRLFNVRTGHTFRIGFRQSAVVKGRLNNQRKAARKSGLARKAERDAKG